MNNQYTKFKNNVLQSITDLSALAVWVYLSSCTSQENYKIKLEDHFDMGKNKINRILAYLNKVNLIKYEQVRNKDGTLGKTTLKVLDGSKMKI